MSDQSKQYQNAQWLQLRVNDYNRLAKLKSYHKYDTGKNSKQEKKPLEKPFIR